jgi:phytoene dehydrogenase-like protein
MCRAAVWGRLGLTGGKGGARRRPGGHVSLGRRRSGSAFARRSPQTLCQYPNLPPTAKPPKRYEPPENMNLPTPRTPVEGLYSASAGTHPAGSVIGAAGHNAAAAVVRDLGLAPGWATA